MISNQLLQNTINKIKAITGMDIAIHDLSGEVAVRTFTDTDLDAATVAGFSMSSDAEGEVQGFKLFKVKDESRDEYILAIRKDGRDDAQLQQICELIKYQAETLLVAYKERFDKDNFFKSLLMDNMLIIDIFERARKLHIDTEAYRAVLMVENEDRRHGDIIENIRSVFAGNSDDFVTTLNNKEIVVVKRVDGPGNYEQVDAAAKKIQDAVRVEAGEEIKISYGSIVYDLKDVSMSYKEARMAADVSNIFFEDRTINPYNKLDIGRLIYQLPVPLCKIFLKEIFGKMSLDDMDQETVTTITKFFENSLNVSETSRQLYIHRNTLVYRLDKLQKNTGLDLRVFDDAITFKIALMVSKYIDYIEGQR